MLKQVTDEIYCLTQPHYRQQTVNSYLVKGAKGYTVLDTGPQLEEARAIWQKLIDDGLVIEKVVITHGHTDHIGLASWFQRHVKVPVIFSEPGVNKLKNYRSKYREAEARGDRPSAFFLEHGGPAIPEKLLYADAVKDYFEPDDVYEPGGFVNIGDKPFQAIWTPGHAEDQCCFWNGEMRLLFSADHVLEGISPVVPTWSDEDGNPLQQYFDSLKALEPYEPQLVLPGHGDPIPDLQARLRELCDGHIRRLQQISDILKKGERTAGEISLEIYGGDVRGFMAALVLSSTISRLVYMREMGSVTSRRHNDGKLYFSLQTNSETG